MAEAFTKDLESHGEGARGIFTFDWKQGAGHAIAWEVENGKAVYRDCQTNEVININDYMSLAKNASYIRTDNREPSEEVLKYVRNRKG